MHIELAVLSAIGICEASPKQKIQPEHGFKSDQASAEM
jgi:hypothetical protein